MSLKWWRGGPPNRYKMGRVVPKISHATLKHSAVYKDKQQRNKCEMDFADVALLQMWAELGALSILYK